MQNPVRRRQAADNSPDRRGGQLHQSRRRNDLILHGELRPLVDVYDFKVDRSADLRLADALQVLDGPLGAKGAPGNEQPEAATTCRRRFAGVVQEDVPFLRTSRPTRTLEVARSRDS